MPQIAIGQATIGAFLDLFSSAPASLAAALRGCPRPWQMLPIQDRPLLRLGGDVVVLDERYLVERVTRGLYWLVHDYEATTYGEKARNKWSQSYSEMIEQRVEDQVREMAPQLLGSQSAFFTEEDLQAAFPGVKNIDAGADFGSEVVLAEVVAGTVNSPPASRPTSPPSARTRTGSSSARHASCTPRPPTCCATPSPRTPPSRPPPSGSCQSWWRAVSSRSTRSPCTTSARR
jgi:hypothetical protein